MGIVFSLQIEGEKEKLTGLGRRVHQRGGGVAAEEAEKLLQRVLKGKSRKTGKVSCRS
jgi:hypothetical protein